MPSKVVIFQSFRNVNVPSWIEQCLDSVRSWAELSNFDYHFIGDELFELVPIWYREKVSNQIHLVTDLARMIKARDFLASDYDCAVWIDADVLIFAPNQFQLPLSESFSFTQEVYIGSDGRGGLKAHRRVNNSVSLMSRGNNFLPFYIDSMQTIVKNNEKIQWTAVGTEFLTLLQVKLPIAKVNNVGLFSPVVMRDIAAGEGRALTLFREHFLSPIYAANLCLTFRESQVLGLTMTDQLFNSVIDQLLENEGGWFNN